MSAGQTGTAERRPMCCRYCGYVYFAHAPFQGSKVSRFQQSIRGLVNPVNRIALLPVISHLIRPPVHSSNDVLKGKDSCAQVEGALSPLRVTYHISHTTNYTWVPIITPVPRYLLIYLPTQVAGN